MSGYGEISSVFLICAVGEGEEERGTEAAEEPEEAGDPQ